MFSKFHKTEFVLSLPIFIISIGIYLQRYFVDIIMSDSTIDINIHDTYYVFGLMHLNTLVAVIGLFIGSILLIFSNKKFSSYLGLYIVFFIAFCIWLYSIVVIFLSPLKLETLPKRYYTNTSFDGIQTIHNLFMLLIPFLLVLFITIVVLKFFSLNKTAIIKDDSFLDLH